MTDTTEAEALALRGLERFNDEFGQVLTEVGNRLSGDVVTFCASGRVLTEDEVVAHTKETTARLLREVADRLSGQQFSYVKLNVALAKLYMGTRPGDELWSEEDYQAVEFAIGHPVERVQALPTPLKEV